MGNTANFTSAEVRYGDSPHFISTEQLRNGAVLHRFDNAAGTPYSAIYSGDAEIFSCVREHEREMVDYWNKMEI